MKCPVLLEQITTSQLAFNMIKALAPEHREELKQQLSIL
jgi:hypothetical protein